MVPLMAHQDVRQRPHAHRGIVGSAPAMPVFLGKVRKERDMRPSQVAKLGHQFAQRNVIEPDTFRVQVLVEAGKRR